MSVSQGVKTVFDKSKDHITVKVDVSGTIRALVNDRLRDIFCLQIPRASSVSTLLECLGVPLYRVGLVTVNHKIAKPDQILQSGDEVKILPIMGGG
jgi:sulfur carrier protein ThiS